jgi:hypothetical protein
MINRTVLLFLLGLLSGSLIAQDIDLEDQLLLYLPMDGDALDHSGNHVPTIVEGPILTEDRFGNPDGAYFFDGRDDSINLNNNLPLITSRSFTISLWVKILGESMIEYGGSTFFEQRDDNASQVDARSTILFTGYFRDRLVIFLRSNLYADYYRTEASADADSEWHHYVARVDENKAIEIYMDAQLAGEGVFGNDGDFVSSVDHVNLGVHHHTKGLYSALYGMMDEVFIYNRALNMCEIEALYNGQLLEER